MWESVELKTGKCVSLWIFDMQNVRICGSLMCHVYLGAELDCVSMHVVVDRITVVSSCHLILPPIAQEPHNATSYHNQSRPVNGAC